MSFTDGLGYFGNFLFFIGAIWVAKKMIIGFHAQLFANVFYMVQATVLQNYPLLMLSIILSCVNIYAIYSWTKEKKPLKKPICNYAEHSYLLEVMKHY